MDRRPDLSEQEMESVLGRFECQRCQQCCKQPGFVYVSPEECDTIAGFLGINAFDFVNQYCELQDKRKLVLKKHSDESCIFLTETGCNVHKVKPLQCRDFPFKWRTPRSFEYCEGLKKIFPQDQA